MGIKLSSGDHESMDNSPFPMKSGKTFLFFFLLVYFEYLSFSTLLWEFIEYIVVGFTLWALLTVVVVARAEVFQEPQCSESHVNACGSSLRHTSNDLSTSLDCPGYSKNYVHLQFFSIAIFESRLAWACLALRLF